jgi:hypothetical protein
MTGYYKIPCKNCVENCKYIKYNGCCRLFDMAISPLARLLFVKETIYKDDFEKWLASSQSMQHRICMAVYNGTPTKDVAKQYHMNIAGITEYIKELMFDFFEYYVATFCLAEDDLRYYALSARSENLLIKNGINTRSDLVKYLRSRCSLLSISGMGRTSADEVYSKLHLSDEFDPSIRVL